MIPKVKYKIFYPNMSKIIYPEVKFIAEHIAKDRGIDVEAIFSKCRQRKYSDARNLTAIIASRLTDLSDAQITKELNYAHHSSMPHAEDLCTSVPELIVTLERYITELTEKKNLKHH